MEDNNVLHKRLHLKQREWVKDEINVDWAEVRDGDLHYMQDIIGDFACFDESLPKLSIDIVYKNGHYNVIFKNWNKFIPGKKWVKTFFDDFRHKSQNWPPWHENPHG